MGLALAYAGGLMTGGQKGLADVPVFAGIGLMGGAMLRDFAIVATAFEVDVVEARKAGLLGVLSLGLGTILPFIVGVAAALSFGYSDAISVTTIGAGAITYIVGPVTGAALGADSTVIALSIATVSANQGNGSEAQRDGAEGCDHNHWAAAQCRNDILLRGHCDHDRDIHRGPKLDPEFDARGQATMAGKPDARGNQQHHRDANPTDVGFDVKRQAEKVADEHAEKCADCEKSDAKNRHWTTLLAPSRT